MFRRSIKVSDLLKKAEEDYMKELRELQEKEDRLEDEKVEDWIEDTHSHYKWDEENESFIDYIKRLGKIIKDEFHINDFISFDVRDVVNQVVSIVEDEIGRQIEDKEYDYIYKLLQGCWNLD